ncbi:MAG: formate/nitrite transporter family protein [Clostridia bacterium]|nr:formate/nitrite transporter family protein [Clostridia bacterium]
MNFFSPAEIAKNAVEIVVKKANLPFNRIMVLAVLAGAYIAFAAEAATMITHDTAPFLGAGVARLLAGAIFSVGLMLVVICGAELFTGNNLLILGVMEKKITTYQMFKNWTYVFAGNFLGAILVVILMFYSGLWEANGLLHGTFAAKIAVDKMNLTFTEAFVRGILCNWLVCLAVWMAYASKDYTGKIIGIFFVITTFVASGFEHSIANMYFVPAGIMALNVPGVLQSGGFSAEALSAMSMQGFLIKNLLPVTLGNVVGGAVFVGMAYWMAFLREEKERVYVLDAEEIKVKA